MRYLYFLLFFTTGIFANGYISPSYTIYNRTIYWDVQTLNYFSSDQGLGKIIDCPDGYNGGSTGYCASFHTTIYNGARLDCPEGQSYDSDVDGCATVCPTGKVWDSNSQSCVSQCSGDHQHYDQDEGRCVCDVGYLSDGDVCNVAPPCPKTDSYGYELVSQDANQSVCINQLLNGSDGGWTYDSETNRYCCYKSLKSSDGNNSTFVKHNKACDYPPFRDGYPYQYTTDSQDDCMFDIAHYSRDGNGTFYQDENCTRFGACYFVYRGSDSNSTLEPGSVNPQIRASVDRLRDDLSQNTNNIIDKLEQVRREIHDKKIDLKPVTDRQDKSNRYLKDINSSLASMSGTFSNFDKLFNADPRQTQEYQEEIQRQDNLKNVLTDSFASIEQSKNDLLALVSASDAPVVDVSSGNCQLCVSVFGDNDFCIDLSVFSQFRPFMLFVLNIILLVWTIRVYVAIFRHITSLLWGGVE